MRLAQRVMIAGLALITVNASARAQAVLSWNVKEGSIEQITRREGDVARLGAQLREQLGGNLPEIVVLQEVTSYAAAVRVARALGYTTATVANSDSGNDREIWPFALEIAVITPRPVVSVTSIQSRADDRFPPFVADLASGTVSYGKAERAIVPAAIRLPEGESIPRAILRVEIEGGTVIYGVHLNDLALRPAAAAHVQRIARAGSLTSDDLRQAFVVDGERAPLTNLQPRPGRRSHDKIVG